MSIAVPVFTLCSLSVAGRITDSLSLEKISGKVRIDVDTSLLGCSFSLSAQADADSKLFTCTGTFLFGLYFTMEAGFSWKTDSEYGWQFALLLDTWRISITYNSSLKKMTGTVQGACTLGALVNSLLKLINPSEKFNRTDVWSFLDMKRMTVILNSRCGTTMRKPAVTISVRMKAQSV